MSGLSSASSLSNVLKEAGPSCLATQPSFKSLIISLPKQDEQEIASCLVWMARTSSDPVASNQATMWTGSVMPPVVDSMAMSYNWQIENFVQVIMEIYPSLNWRGVMEKLDCEEFYCSDHRAFDLLVKAYACTKKGDFPLDLFWGKWSFKKGQVSFLRQATQAQREFLDIVRLSPDRILTPDNLINIPASTRAIANGWLNQQWNSLSLLRTITSLAGCGDRNAEEEAKLLLDLGSRQATELVCIGLCKLEKPWQGIHLEAVRKLVMVFVVGHSSSTFVLTRVWPLEKEIVMDAMVEWYRQDPAGLSRILDITQELKALTHILDFSKSVLFSIDLAALASRREYLNLEKWLLDSIEKKGEDFKKVYLEFIQMKLVARAALNASVVLAAPNVNTKTIPLHEDTMQIFAKVMQMKSNVFVASNLGGFFKETLNMLAQLNSSTSGLDIFSEDYPKAVEDEASSYYEKMYGGQLACRQIIEILEKLNNSGTNQDVQLMNCIIFILVDEFKAFSKYPDEQLMLAAELFGLIILRSHLLSPNKLAAMLRIVLESVKRPVKTKLFKFGLKALQQFAMKLKEYPSYCSSLLQINHLNEAFPELIQILNDASSGAKENVPQNSSSLSSVDMTNNSDKLLFLLNNLSESNLAAKSKEIKALLTNPSNLKWFSNYLVVNRIAVEPNNHKLYLNLIYDGLTSADLNKNVLDETLANIKILLQSEKTITSTQERSLLKNLGSWLGQITLARDKPLREKDLSLKILLIEGFISGRLIVIIPFVCKVLEQSKNSRAFKSSNPWMMALLKLLVELYYYAELKLNLKFEVEVLLRNINIEIKHIETSRVIRETIQQMNQQQQYNQQYTQQQQIMNQQFVQQTQLPQAKINKFNDVPSIGVDEEGNMFINNLVNFINYNHPVIINSPVLKRILLVAMDRTIREIIMPVVERSVSIALVATRELVLKDFSSEPNEERLRIAGITMVQSLAGNLAMVTSKEPFRINLVNQVRVLAMQTLGDNANLDMILEQVINENVELGCLVIQKAAMERSLTEITSELQPNMMQRRKTRERGLEWVDDYANRSRANMVIPDPNFRYRQQQMTYQVYEDFSSVLGGISAPQTTLRANAQITGKAANEGPQLAAAKRAIAPPQSAPTAYSIVLKSLESLIARLNQSIKANCQSFNVSNLPSDHELVGLVRQINAQINQSPSNEVMLWLCENLIKNLFVFEIKSDADNKELTLRVEVYIVLLERMSEMNKRIGRELVMYLTFNLEEILSIGSNEKTALIVVTSLVNNGLINIYEFDSYLSQKLEAIRINLIKFTIRLVDNLTSSKPAVCTHLEFYYTLSVLNSKLPALQIELSQQKQSFEELQILKRLLAHVFVQTKEDFSKDDELYRQVVTSAAPVGISGSLSITSVRRFFEAAVENYYKFRNFPGTATPIAYLELDKITQFILSNYSKCFENVSVFTSLLSLISLLITHSHDIRRDAFDSRPYFRILVTLLEELDRRGDNIASLELYYTAFGNCLHSMRPNQLPSFVYSFIQLVSHKFFLQKILAHQQSVLHVLLLDVFNFLSPFLRHAELTDPIRLLYKGTLRLLLILLHDFPQFLCEHHFSLCDVIPPTCIQLRNLILSAFPRNMRLPDPFTRDLKIDLLPETFKQPEIHSDYMHNLRKNPEFLKQLDAMLKSNTSPFSSREGGNAFIQNFLLKDEEVYSYGSHYNIPLINSFVLYVGIFAIEQKQGTVSKNDGRIMELYKQIVMALDSEGRYHFLNAIANHLRYPNSHTHYFSCVLLFLFVECSNEVMKEQITRVLLERLIVNRPHPWGMLITFIELLKNPRYDFWSHKFTTCAPDIEKLFTSVARSCMIPIEAGIGSK